MYSFKLPTIPTATAPAVISVPGVQDLATTPGKALGSMASTFGSTLTSLAGSLPNPKLPAGFKNPFSGLMGTTSIFGKKPAAPLNMQPLTTPSGTPWTSPQMVPNVSLLQPVSSQGARGSL